MKEKVLIKFRANWADEFDICGWQIEDANSWVKTKEKFADEYADEEFTFYFGTNEYLEYNNAEQLLEEIDEIFISDEEAVYISKIFQCDHMTDTIDIYSRITYLIDNELET